MTKVTAFDVPCGPMVFRSEAYRRKALLRLGDLIVLVGTNEAAPADRGRMLGMMETAATYIPGNARWQFGIANRAAWVLPQKPRFPLPNDPKRFWSKAGATTIALYPDEAAVVLAAIPLEAREAVPLASGAEAAAHESWTRTGAPPPAMSRAAVANLNNGPASTYLFVLYNAAGVPVGFKVGWAGDYQARLDEFNAIALPDLGGLHYRLGRHWAWRPRSKRSIWNRRSLHNSRNAGSCRTRKWCRCRLALH